MKLLFDENVSPKLPDMLANEYPGSTHVTRVGLRGAADQQIWDYSRAQGFAIVSKNTDFRERSFVEGFPPKVIWLDVGNAGIKELGENYLIGREFWSYSETRRNGRLYRQSYQKLLHDPESPWIRYLWNTPLQ